jgi:hypothetical protein
MLVHLLDWCPELLPRLGQSSEPQPAQIAMQSFWAVAAGDAVLCCQQAVLDCLGETARRELRADLATRRSPPTLPQLPLLSDEVVVSATNAVSRALGVPQHSLQPLEEMAQRHGQQLELMLRESLPGNDSAKHSLRPPDFIQAAALTAIQLVGRLLKTGQRAAMTQAALELVPAQVAVSASPANATLGSWQDLAPGHQWALACIPALTVLGRINVSSQLRTAWRELRDAADTLLPSYIAADWQMLPQPQPFVADNPRAAISQGPQQPEQQQHIAYPSLPLDSLKQLQPAQSACCQQARQQPLVNNGAHVAVDVPFPRLCLLPTRARVTVMGLVAKCSEAKVGIIWRLR